MVHALSSSSSSSSCIMLISPQRPARARVSSTPHGVWETLQLPGVNVLHVLHVLHVKGLRSMAWLLEQRVHSHGNKGSGSVMRWGAADTWSQPRGHLTTDPGSQTRGHLTTDPGSPGVTWSQTRGHLGSPDHRPGVTRVTRGHQVTDPGGSGFTLGHRRL